MIVGSPKTVIEKIKTMIRVLRRPGTFALFPGSRSPSATKTGMNSIRLMGQEVIPRGQRNTPRKSTWSISSPAYRARSNSRQEQNACQSWTALRW